MAEKLGWKVVEFADALGVSRAKGYQIVAAHPELAVKIGADLRVLPDRARAWIARQATAPESVDVTATDAAVVTTRTSRGRRRG